MQLPRSKHEPVNLAQNDRSTESFRLSGRAYIRRLKQWKAAGYRIEMIFLRLPSPQLALRRVAARVRQGGHNVPRADILRRFDRSWIHFNSHYRLLADRWEVYDNSQQRPRLLEIRP
jgi:predicted ABC-type ATPase